jgi:glycosyltransferase involved in cell wall biosynthesis
MDKFLPYFSIVLPVFNRETRISFAVQSVLDQTYTSWELLIIDDCSNDKSQEIIKEFRDDRIRVFRNQKNEGPAISRNVGIQNAKGQIISFLDSDDKYYPDFLLKTRQLLLEVNPNVGFIWTGLEV